MRGASGPAIRTTPIPPRPAGVAIATMVSWVVSVRLRRDHDGLQKRVADALGRDFRIVCDGQVHDTPRVGIERADFLGLSAGLRLLHEELGHLPKLRVLALAESHRIDDVVPVAPGVAPERGVDDDLERVEGLAFA